MEKKKMKKEDLLNKILDFINDCSMFKETITGISIWNLNIYDDEDKSPEVIDSDSTEWRIFYNKVCFFFKNNVWNQEMIAYGHRFEDILSQNNIVMGIQEKTISDLIVLFNEIRDYLEVVTDSQLSFDDKNDYKMKSLYQIESKTIKKAVEDAQVFIKNGKYESAVDRVHTVLHGYLMALLKSHGESFTDDAKMTALFSKLYSYYENIIQPKDVAERIKGILRSAGGVISNVNELRNNNTVAHPNEQLIQEREAKLVIGIVDAIISYIDDIENKLLQNT